jgi:membrane protein
MVAIGINPIIETLAVILVSVLIAMILVWYTDLTRRAEGKRGMLGLSLSTLLPIGCIVFSGLTIFGLHTEAAGAIVLGIGILTIPMLMAIFALLGVSLNRLLFALSEDNNDPDRLPAATWHKPMLTVCLALFFGKTVMPNSSPIISLLGGVGTWVGLPVGGFLNWIYLIVMLAAAWVVISKTRMSERLPDNWGFYTAAIGAVLSIFSVAFSWIMFASMPVSEISVSISLASLALSFVAGCLLIAGMIWVFLTLTPDEYEGYKEDE